MRVLVAKERGHEETRVSATPETVRQMVKAGFEVQVSSGAGDNAYFDDKSYETAGATIASDFKKAWSEADVVLTVCGTCFDEEVGDETKLLKEGAILIGFLNPAGEPERVKELADRKVTTLAMELIPRITRAQKMDALSSQANIAGYKAVLMAAYRLPKYFPMLMTAAGTVKPARVVVMGAGVAGLQAIATARRLGAIVEASDIRPEVKEQIESLGAKFIEPPDTGEELTGEGGYAKEVSKEYLAAQQKVVAEKVAQADVVITTALVPGKKAPVLVTAETVQKMRPGGVIVDLAAGQGGNCELTELDKEVRKHGVLIVGHPNIPATMPADSSAMYARNVAALLLDISKEGKVEIDLTHDVMSGAVLTHEGKIHHRPTAEALGVEPAPPPPAKPEPEEARQ